MFFEMDEKDEEIFDLVEKEIELRLSSGETLKDLFDEVSSDKSEKAAQGEGVTAFEQAKARCLMVKVAGLMAREYAEKQGWI